jgi:hypothetical protein
MSPLPDVPTVTHIPAPAIGGQPAPQLLPGLSEPRQHHPASHTHVTPAPASARLRRAGTVTDDRDTNGKVRTLAHQSDGKRAAEITRLLASPPARLPGHAEHWSAWRRRHQARADWYRQRTRLHRDPEISLAS